MAAKRSSIDLIRYFLDGIDITAISTTIIIPSLTGRKFIPQGAVFRTTSEAGTILVSGIIRLGNNGNHDNVAPLLTLGTSLVADSVVTIPLVASLTAIDLGSTGISVEVQTAATGTGLTLVGEVHLWGLMLP